MLNMSWSDKEYVSFKDMWRWSIKDPRVCWCFSYLAQEPVSILKVVPLDQDIMARDHAPILVRPGHVDPELFKHDIMLALLGQDILVIEPIIVYDSTIGLPNLENQAP